GWGRGGSHQQLLVGGNLNLFLPLANLARHVVVDTRGVVGSRFFHNGHVIARRLARIDHSLKRLNRPDPPPVPQRSVASMPGVTVETGAVGGAGVDRQRVLGAGLRRYQESQSQSNQRHGNKFHFSTPWVSRGLETCGRTTTATRYPMFTKPANRKLP